LIFVSDLALYQDLTFIVEVYCRRALAFEVEFLGTKSFS